LTLLLLDNYDSFVHNLARYFERLGQSTCVVRNDAVDALGVRVMRPAAVVLSPGPCTPAKAGCSLELVRELHRELPMLGVCLGHQTIAEALGGRVVRAARPVHGQTSPVHHDGTGIFTGLPSPLAACRYHSLVVEPASLPATLRPTAWTDDGILMAFEHVELPVYGVQFHPEAILTEGGHRLLANFLCLAGLETTGAPDDLAADELSAPTADARPLPTQPVTF
jgi:anthranilate synthase/aminodeoxychorismate synthase-like glutamine amidotransferase